MQDTRQYILDILKRRGHATVDEIVDDLQQSKGQITAVTVRHHLSRLQDEHLVNAPTTRHRESPGRPQHVYTLTEKANSVFPNNYQQLAEALLKQIQARFQDETVNVIFEDIANDMAKQASIPSGTLVERLESVVNYLNEHGYEAHWEKSIHGYILHTANCPYHHLSKSDESLCHMDMRLIAAMLGVIPRRLSRIAEGDPSCSYLISGKND